jgi:hypothetical protein
MLLLGPSRNMTAMKIVDPYTKRVDMWPTPEIIVFSLPSPIVEVACAINPRQKDCLHAALLEQPKVSTHLHSALMCISSLQMFWSQNCYTFSKSI